MEPEHRVVRYLAGGESLRRRELVWGVVREPPAPFWPHQQVVTRATVLLHQHVSARRLGKVCAAPLDVVLDASLALIVQPDVLYISRERLGLVRNQVWGAPDLVVEVESTGTRQRDRVSKRLWYRRYGVREYWLVDPQSESVTVFSFDANGRGRQKRTFLANATVRSLVLPEFEAPAVSFFDRDAF